MKKRLTSVLLACLPLTAMAGVTGEWTTEKNDEGGYLQVTIAACASDASKYCGTIVKAVGKSGEDPDYPHLGKLIIANMSDDGDEEFSDGTIWDPERDKTFKSKMELKGDQLDVDGCIAFLCEGQVWKRVK